MTTDEEPTEDVDVDVVVNVYLQLLLRRARSLVRLATTT